MMNANMFSPHTKQGPNSESYLRCCFISQFYLWTTSLTLFWVTVLNSSNLFRNIHLVPMIVLTLGVGTKCHTWFLSNWWTSSCIATIQSEFSLIGWWSWFRNSSGSCFCAVSGLFVVFCPNRALLKFPLFVQNLAPLSWKQVQSPIPHCDSCFLLLLDFLMS